MTVESSARKQTFAGGQSALTFSFRTLVAHPEYIKVAVTSGSTQMLLTYNVDYTVSLNASGVGGTVTVSPSYSTAYTQTVYRDTDDLQESDYDDFNQFPADTLEDDLDRRTLISQERSDDLDRTAQLPVSYTGNTLTLPLPQDGLSLVWSGGQLINSNLAGPSGATGAIGPSGASGSGSVTLVSSSTSDVTVVSTSTTPIITAVNAATAGANKILRLDSSGKLPTGLDASQVTGLLGSWAARSISTVYQAATDLIVVAYGIASATDGGIIGKTDSSNPPTTIRIESVTPGSDYPSITFPVKKGDFWSVTTAFSGVTSPVIWYIPFGS